MSSNEVPAAERRRQLDKVMDEVRRAFGGKSNHAILRGVVGTPEWRTVMRGLGYSDHVLNLPSEDQHPPQPVEGRNAPFKAAMRERWFFVMDGWPLIGGERVEILEALLMPTELADYPRATWNPKEEHDGAPRDGAGSSPPVEEAVLPYASYD